MVSTTVNATTTFSCQPHRTYSSPDRRHSLHLAMLRRACNDTRSTFTRLLIVVPVAVEVHAPVELFRVQGVQLFDDAAGQFVVGLADL